MGILARAGYEFTPRADEADVLVVNTCSFIAPAQQESVQYDSGDGRIQEIRPRAKADRRRMPGRALPRRNPRADSRSRRGDRHGRSGKNSRSRAKASCAARMPQARQPADVSLSRPHAAHSLHAAPRRLHQDRRRLRSSLHVLHHPAVARKIPQPPLRIRRARSGKSRRGGRARNYADRPGHHLLRRRPRPARRPCRCCSSASRRSKTCTGCAFSTAIRTASRSACSTRSPRIRASRNIWTCRCSTPAATSSRA